MKSGKTALASVQAFFKKEIVLCLSFAAALLSVLAVSPDAKYASYIDMKTLVLLFALMTTVAGFNDIGLFAVLAQRLVASAANLRRLTATLVALCFFSSMIITNDVALITFVPFTILLLSLAKATKFSAYIIILETVAANLGSMATPIGNPQNIFLFSAFKVDFLQFEKIMLPLVLLSFACVLAAVLGVKKETLSLSVPPAGQRVENFSLGSKGAAYIFTFTLSVLCVAKILPYQILFVAVFGCVFLCDKKILLKTDYALLATFACFFVFVGNLQRLEKVQDAIQKFVAGREFFSAVALSQIISNVPAAVLLSAFSDNATALLYGTNVGGLGTPIASLASLISFKLYSAQKDADSKRYLLLFLLVNAIFLAVLYAAGAFFLSFRQEI